MFVEQVGGKFVPRNTKRKLLYTLPLKENNSRKPSSDLKLWCSETLGSNSESNNILLSLDEVRVKKIGRKYNYFIHPMFRSIQPRESKHSRSNGQCNLISLGTGSYGTVLKGQYKGDLVAVKLFGSEELRDDEYRAMKHLPGDRTVGFPFMHCKGEVHSRVYYIVYDIIEGNTLDEYFRVPRSKSELLQAFTKLSEIVRILHDEMKMRHRDIKADNVLVNKEGEVFLIDFGKARTANDEKYNMVSALNNHKYKHHHPEYNKPNGEGPHTDVYAVAIMLRHYLQKHEDSPGNTALSDWIATALDIAGADHFAKRKATSITTLHTLLSKACAENHSSQDPSDPSTASSSSSCEVFQTNVSPIPAKKSPVQAVCRKYTIYDYSCHLCDKFVPPMSLKGHMNAHHAGATITFFCASCKFPFSQKRLLFQHFKKAKNNACKQKLFSCTAKYCV